MPTSISLEFESLPDFHIFNTVGLMENFNDIRLGEDIVFLCFMFIWSLLPDTDAAYSQKRYLTSCKSYFRAYAKDFEAEVVEFDGEDDHVHLLVAYPPKIAVSHLVNSLKVFQAD